MIKNLLSLLLLFVFFIGYSQIPVNYYSSATGSGYTLKTQLKNIIKNGHIDQGYGSLYDGYIKTDNDNFYENDNTVLDMYSENPNGNDPYNYQHNQRNCGNYNSENDCYNREHVFPQGFFNENLPMRSDIHHVIPTDGYVNWRRSNFPFGEVSNASWTSDNGSKVGTNTFDSFKGTVFEPINEFKGDIARMLLYFATRYEDEVLNSSWDDHDSSESNPLNGSKNQFYESWYIRLLHKWHIQDPVNQREIVRNNEAYKYQGNRNPFIDHPEYVAQIWGNVLSTKIVDLDNSVKMYPNPAEGNSLFFKTSETVTIQIFTILGKQILSQKIDESTSQMDITSLKSGIYLVKISSSKISITKKLIKK